MPAHPLLILKLKEALSDHMQSLPSAPVEVEDYKHLETLDGFVKNAEVDKWVKEMSAALEPIAVHDWLEWSMHFLLQLATLVEHECEVKIKREKVYVLEEHVTEVQVKEDAQLAHCKAHEAEKWTLFIAEKISVDEFEGDVSTVSDAGKDKGCMTKRKTAEVIVGDSEGSPSAEIIPNDSLIVKAEVFEFKASGSSGSRPRLTAHSSSSSTTVTLHFLKKSVDKLEQLVTDMITWHLESNARKLAMVLAECEIDKRELEKVRREICAVKRALDENVED
ncbi:hypothetical protein EW146_g900 [Bondarzewia mesenterica]|uniref:Uncharacterized protein n=1 Tax=Bondarzewia mesenterica TaxID=1095465 RepID=A0A4S4M5H3_9AGAM|nr:hypothetical protein EW146_g900 [Bondarzewia mesenterica]